MCSPRASSTAGRVGPSREGYGAAMFLFFNNRMGCLGSLVVSAVFTLLLLLVTGVID